MATNPAVPYWDEADTVTAHAGAAITGKRFVAISGAMTDGNPTMTHAAADAMANPAGVGVAAYDAPVGTKFTAYTGNQVMPVRAGAAITAGQTVESNAAGEAVPSATGAVLGVAYGDAALGADAPIKLAR